MIALRPARDVKVLVEVLRRGGERVLRVMADGDYDDGPQPAQAAHVHRARERRGTHDPVLDEERVRILAVARPCRVRGRLDPGEGVEGSGCREVDEGVEQGTLAARGDED